MTPKWKPDLLTFDAASHSYTYDGKPMPSATQIMEIAGITKKYDGDPFFSERGTAVHLACHIHDEGCLNWVTLDPQLEPYLRTYAAWKEASGFKVLHSEMPVCNPDLGYAGTLDRIGELDGRTVIIDIKTGQRARSTGVQLALYNLCFSDDDYPYPMTNSRWAPHWTHLYALHLSATEPAKLIEYADPEDYDAARGAVAVAKWRLKHMRKWPSGVMGEDAMIEPAP